MDGKKGKRTRERFRDRSSPTPFLPKPCGKSRRRVRGRERKCINAARNVRDDEVAVYTLYRMHEIFGSRESPLLRRGKVYESPWKLTFFMDRRRGERAAETAIYPRAATAYIVLSSEEASERRLLRVFEREDESTGGKRWFVSFATTTPSSLAVTHYPPEGDILFDEENVRV